MEDHNTPLVYVGKGLVNIGNQLLTNNKPSAIDIDIVLEDLRLIYRQLLDTKYQLDHTPVAPSMPEPIIAPEPEPSVVVSEPEPVMVQTSLPVVDEEEEDTYVVDEKAPTSSIMSIKSQIGINQKFAYLRELFNNNVQAYNSIIDQLDHCENLQHAEETFAKLMNQQGWSYENGQVLSLFELVELRYLNQK